MKINHLIDSLFNSDINIFDIDGSKVDNKKIKQEYLSIINYLNKNLCLNDILAISLKKGYKYLLVMLACMRLGITYIPLRDSWPDERITQIKKISNFKLLINELNIDTIVNYNSNNIELMNNEYKNPLYIMFTSGSTGEPKGVIIKRESYANFLQWIDSYFPHVNSSDRLLNSTDYTFDVSLVDIGLLLVKKLNYFISDFNDNLFKFAYELSLYKISIVATVPNNFTMILNDKLVPKMDLSNLKNVLIAGSRFPSQLYEKFNKYLPNLNIYNCYGPTEATIYCVVKKMTKDELIDIVEDTVSIGKPILNIKAKVVDDSLNDVEDGSIGELLIGGIQVMDKYINNSQIDSLVVIDRIKYYKTGDLVFIKNNNYFVVGRKDDTIKTSGFRVNLLDIDNYINKLESVEDCYTIAIDNKIKENILVSFLTLNFKIDIKSIYGQLKEILLSYQIPEKIIILEEFPLNNSGKVCKKTLKKKYLESLE